MRRGASAASVLLGISAAGWLSLTWLPSSLVVMGAVALSLVPSLFLRLFGLPRQLGHSARGEAVFWQGRSLAVCSEAYKEQLSGSSGRRIQLLPFKFDKGWLLGPLLALLLAPAAHSLFCPQLRVINLTDERLSLYADGHWLGNVEPTSGENPAAGRAFLVPSGTRRLKATATAGRVVANESVTLRAGYRHLFAPGAREDCFYLQQLTYGRSSAGAAAGVVEQRRPLISGQRFWVIGSEVDPWFVAEKSVEPGVTSGGRVTLLRMGRCR